MRRTDRSAGCRRDGRLRDRDGGQRPVDLARIEASARSEPVLRCELEVAVVRPVGQNAQDLVEVRERVDGVEAATRDDAEDRRGGLGVSIGAVEEPRLPLM